MATGRVRDPQCHRAPEPGRTILHSDRGRQFGSKKVRRLDNHDLVGSMGRVGTAYDNAAMESFFSLLQKERARHPTVGDPQETPPRDRHMDRNQVQPATTPTSPRQAHAGREMIYTTADAA
jgi:transposase InsO family protein